jgi:hypothetical protein
LNPVAKDIPSAALFFHPLFLPCPSPFQKTKTWQTDKVNGQTVSATAFPT